jgi:hypothetical protein
MANVVLPGLPNSVELAVLATRKAKVRQIIPTRFLRNFDFGRSTELHGEPLEGLFEVDTG